MSSNIFNTVELSKPRRNKFDLSHERKFSLNHGDLVPIFCQDVLPGDTWKLNTEILLRMAPLIAPAMHRVNVFTHFFFVPNRLIWNNWEKFITGEGAIPPIIHPRIRWRDEMSTTAKVNVMRSLRSGGLGDYMGLPVIPDNITSPNDIGEFEFSTLPFRAYQLIYNEYYRDETLQQEVDIPLGDYSDVWQDEAAEARMLIMRRRNWEKDYFTSALPFAQKGSEVLIPLEFGDYVVKYLNNGRQQYIVNNDLNHDFNGASGTLVDGRADPSDPNNVNRGRFQKFFAGGPGSSPDDWGINLDPNGTLGVSLNDSKQTTTINDLRTAFQVQRWLERNARGGTRYTEQLLVHFGVRSKDSRLQRPEYLGGGKAPVAISEVLQTSASDSTTPQGNMAGHGYSVSSTHGFKRFFTEHGYIIGIMSIMPKPSYQQGLPRQFFRFDKFDYYWPVFAHLGEQEVKNKELYHDYSRTNQVYNENTFGYQSRYAEYKYIPSSVHGDFKTTLNYWHFGRIFGNKPALNGQFIEVEDIFRPFAVIDGQQHHYYCMMYHNCKAVRPLPVFSSPGLIDHN